MDGEKSVRPLALGDYNYFAAKVTGHYSDFFCNLSLCASDTQGIQESNINAARVPY
jgi:hypothetical protein